MTVVSDASVFINLAIIGQLELLPSVFEKITVPDAVFQEVVTAGANKPGSEELKSATWLEVRRCNDKTLLNQLALSLDPGEAEAIALAVELDAELLIIDEKRGRNIAQSLHLKVTGLLGVLLSAKNKGLISSVRPLMEQLQTEANFRIDGQTFETVLKLAQE